MKLVNSISGFFYKVRKHSIATRLLFFFTVSMIVPYFAVIVLLYNHFRTSSINVIYSSISSKVGTQLDLSVFHSDEENGYSQVKDKLDSFSSSL